MERAFRAASVVLYVAVAVALGALAFVLIGTAVWQLARAGFETGALLETIGITVVGLAVFDVAKYLIEEEVMRDRELRSPAEARRTLTKFLTIVIIAMGLESVVFVFMAGKENLTQLPYPAALLAVVAALVAVLGHYQRESRKAETDGARG
jgi:hypothetical protein